MNTTDLPAPEIHPPTPPKKRHRFLKILGGSIVALVALIVIISVATAGHSNNTAAPAAKASTSAPAAPAAAKPAPSSAAPTTQAPTQAPSPAAPTTPAAPAMTVAEQQAVTAAQQYLSLGSGFSAYSLNQQLTSSSGSGFSQADAQYAINALNPIGTLRPLRQPRAT